MKHTVAPPPVSPCTPTPEDPNARVTIDGREPDFVIAPESDEACRELVRWAVRERVALVPVGGGTSLHVGNPLQAGAWCAVSMARLAGIVDYSPADLTVVAHAGATLAEIGALVGASGQWLPYDVPQPECATAGGLAATNGQGLLRCAFGAPRDRLLGLRVVLADGSAVRAGGRTVKNVAGYDLTKLFTGSRGTLGIITEVTIRTAALSPVRETLAFASPTARAAADAALAVFVARLEPLTLAATGGPSPTVRVTLAGNAERVGWQRAAVTELLATHQAALTDDLANPRDVVERCPVQARCVVRVSEVPGFVERVDASSTAVYADAASGVVEVGFGDDRDVIATMHALRAALPEGGWLVWTRLPVAAKRDGDVWFPVPESAGVMCAVKRALDPDRVFSPGRFAGRL
jgi:glycolate oxidase FAD binding subunit